VSTNPTCHNKFGARKIQNTRQSRYDTGPSIIVLSAEFLMFMGVYCGSGCRSGEVCIFGNLRDQVLSGYGFHINRNPERYKNDCWMSV
jgi:hypothetical protein